MRDLSGLGEGRKPEGLRHRDEKVEGRPRQYLERLEPFERLERFKSFKSLKPIGTDPLPQAGRFSP